MAGNQASGFIASFAGHTQRTWPRNEASGFPAGSSVYGFPNGPAVGVHRMDEAFELRPTLFQ